MRYRLLSVALAVASPIAATSTVSAQETTEQRVRRILSEVPLIDGHNDLPGKIREVRTGEGDVGLYDLRGRADGDTDLPRLREGMVGAQFWSVHVDVEHPRPTMQQLEQIDIAHRIIEAYPDELEFAGSVSDIHRVFGKGKIASLLGMEGGHVIENSLGALRAFYEAGVRYMGLTHFSNTDWADSGTDEVIWDGLSPFGEEVVREMNRMGMLVDLAHVSPATMSDALDVTEAPVIFSHAAARQLADHPRNVPDSILTRLRENGGVLMQLFYPPYLDIGDEPSATIADVADHIEHIRDAAGIDHVGIGSDFDGIPTYVDGLEDVSTYPALFAELVRRGWSDSDLRKLAGENVLRVMAEVEAVARRLQRERSPSTKTIEEMDGLKAQSAALFDRVEHQYADSDGVRIHYVTVGEGPLVVMIHGFPDFWYSWRDQMVALEGQYRVAAIDQRGYNRSDKPAGVDSYAMRLLVQDVAAVVADQGQESAIVVGHDWGGMVAWSMAMFRPDVVDRLIVLNLPHPQGLSRELANNPDQARNSQYARNFQQEGSHDALTAEGLAGWVDDEAARIRYVEAMERSDFEAMMAYYKANYPRLPYQESPGPGARVTMPVLMIHGLDDQYLLSGALNETWEWLDADLTLVTIPGAGHFVQQDASDLVTRSILAWLRR